MFSVEQRAAGNDSSSMSTKIAPWRRACRGGQRRGLSWLLGMVVHASAEWVRVLGEIQA